MKAPTFVLSVFVLCGCAAGEPRDAGPAVRDSAGIAIVENRGAAWGEGEGWRLGERPLLEIGAMEGAPEYQLFRTRTARRLPDGGLLIANGGTNELRFYDSGGRHVRTVGREGGGPGEFRALWDAWVYGDSVVAFDMSARRVTVFDSAGLPARTFAPGGEETRDQLIAVLADGSLVIQRVHFQGMIEHLQELELFHGTATGESGGAIGRFPYWKLVPVWLEENRVVMMSGDIFGARTQVAVGGGQVYVAIAREPEVEVRTVSGDVVRKIRWPEPDPRVTPADRDAYTANRLATVEEEAERAALRERLADATWATEFPALEELLVDADGNVWVRRFRRPREPESNAWTVFEPGGRLLGEVDLPEGFRPTEIGSDYVAGLATDDLDVQYARVYRLDKGAVPPIG